MREYLELGSAPADEPCAQLGAPDYEANARKEAMAYIQAIRRKLGKEPEGAKLSVKGFEHDFGRYYEVVCHYDPELPNSVDYAFRVEGEAPVTWEEVGMEAPVTYGERER